LDNLPPGLQRLNCAGNNITTLDNLQPGLLELNWGNNRLI
jgi:Leucine-rich repeat (LRR) protein